MVWLSRRQFPVILWQYSSDRCSQWGMDIAIMPSGELSVASESCFTFYKAAIVHCIEYLFSVSVSKHTMDIPTQTANAPQHVFRDEYSTLFNVFHGDRWWIICAPGCHMKYCMIYLSLASIGRQCSDGWLLFWPNIAALSFGAHRSLTNGWKTGFSKLAWKWVCPNSCQDCGKQLDLARLQMVNAGRKDLYWTAWVQIQANFMMYFVNSLKRWNLIWNQYFCYLPKCWWSV